MMDIDLCQFGACCMPAEYEAKAVAEDRRYYLCERHLGHFIGMQEPLTWYVYKLPPYGHGQ